jgi:hypothetical protein
MSFNINSNDRFILYDFKMVLITLDLLNFPIIDDRPIEWQFRQISFGGQILG